MKLTMQIAYYVNTIIHTLGKSDQGSVTFPKVQFFKLEKARHSEILPPNRSIHQTN